MAVKSRSEAFESLLEPIRWDWSTSVQYRRELVSRRRREMTAVYPFLNEAEQELAIAWLKDNRHEELWE